MSASAKAVPLTSMPLPTVKGIFDALTERFGLSPRDSQLTLAQHVRNTVASGGVCCVEAPTGTGKTLGYLAGALDAYAHAGTQLPIVVATATVGLQEQIIRHDIPRLAAVGAVDPRKVAVAKGRGRYFCPRTAALLEDKKMQDGQSDMFAPEKHVADGGTQIALDMLKAWRKMEWDGDRDNWNGPIPACWEASCGASSDTCVNRACEHYANCPYMISRQKLGVAQVIVANHDIVLADLAQRADEQTTTALPPKRYALIFDEAHNLPEKAVATRRAVARLHGSDWLRKLEGYGEATLNTPRIIKALSHSDCSADVFSAGAALLLAGLERLGNSLAETRTFELGGTSSWGLTAPDDALLHDVLDLAGQALSVLSALHIVAKAYAELAEESVGAEKAFAVRMLAQTHQFHRKAKDLQEGLTLFCSRDRLVRWVTRNRDNQLALHTQPLEGQEVLDKLLWGTDFPISLVSATLQIAGSFDRFRKKSGLPGHAITDALPPVFDYTRGFLHQPKMDCAPGEEGYELELVNKLERLYNGDVAQGMLVLFTSREAMRRVMRGLPPQIRDVALVQDNRPLPELIAQHKERIDRGERSILAGLDSMAEGLDLPGKYCGHVVITRLPFAVPGDPVEEARRISMGDDWFNEAYLADMLTMLIQACGRLIRREDDYGVITVLDKRLTTKKYRLTAFQALPQFTRGVTLAEYRKMVADRALDAAKGAKPPEKGRPVLVVHSNPEAPAGTRHEAKGSPAVRVVEGGASPHAAAPVNAASSARGDGAEHPDALADLHRAAAAPMDTGKATRVHIDQLATALAKALPPAKGPFPEHEPAYVTDHPARPCLPAGSAARVWSERQLPQATMLGIRLANLPWASKAAPWEQVFSLRPDLVQYVEVLRAHRNEWLDERNSVLSEQQCERQLERALAGLGEPSPEMLMDALSRFEADAVAVLNTPHKLPGRELLLEMPQAAQALARELRARDR